MRFCVPDNDDARYAHIVAVTVRLNYAKLKRVLHGASLHKRYRSPVHAFARRHTPGDTVVLAEVGRAHGTLWGLPRCICLAGLGLAAMPAWSACRICRSRTCTTCAPARSTRPGA